MKVWTLEYTDQNTCGCTELIQVFATKELAIEHIKLNYNHFQEFSVKDTSLSVLAYEKYHYLNSNNIVMQMNRASLEDKDESKDTPAYPITFFITQYEVITKQL